MDYGVGLNTSDQGYAVLTPIPQTPTITWATPAPIVYGTALSATQLNATADVPGTFSYVLPPYNPAQGVVLNAGQTVVTAVFRPTDTVDYASATFIQTITVTPAPLTITTNNATMVHGAPLPVLSGTVTGLVNGDHDAFVFTTNATSASPAGSYVISPTPAPNPGLDYNNYAISFHTGTLTILPAPAVSVQNGTLIVDDTAAPTGMPTTTISLDAAGQNYVVNTGGSIQTVAKSAVYNNYVQFKGSLLGHDSVNASTLPTTVLFATMGYGDGNVFTGGFGLNYIMWMSGSGNTEIDNGGRVYTFNYTGGSVTKIGNATWYN